MKKCNACLITKELTDFTAVTTRHGTASHASECKPCMVIRKRAYRMSNRAKFTEYKKTLSCKTCGNDDHRVLEFHHVSDDKSNGVSEMVHQGYSLKNVMAEVAKCDVLCANCHRIVHSA